MKNVFYLFVLLFCFNSNAQNILVPESLNFKIEDSIQSQILTNLDSLFFQINRDKINDRFILSEKSKLTVSVLKGLKNYEENKKDSISDFYKKQLINCYSIEGNQYFLSIAYISATAELKAIFNLIAKKEDNEFRFALPLQYLTRNWNSKTVGTTRYFFKNELNEERAAIFNSKNITIAQKLGVRSEGFKFYMCANYQEILQLLGYEYDLESAGTTRNGYGVDEGHIFSIQNNEDFSHDVFHYYSGKINENKNRNWITEEGIAYSWGNAYWTDSAEVEELVEVLKKYLRENPKVKLFDLFEQNAKIFENIAPEISARSTISAVICDEIERKHGKVGISKIINCGRKPSHHENYMKAIDELLGINEKSFNKRVKALLKAR